jgi:hypothetical protein
MEDFMSIKIKVAKTTAEVNKACQKGAIAIYTISPTSGVPSGYSVLIPSGEHTTLVEEKLGWEPYMVIKDGTYVRFMVNLKIEEIKSALKNLFEVRTEE